ncbi:putative membrane protein [Carboxydocella thermautotrophica]|nr:putative membrane protein [Carboxydocella thermautotrophica]
MTKLQASMLALLGGASYGLLPGFAKQAYASGVGTGPLTLTQNLIGAILLWSIAFIAARGQSKPDRRQILQLLLTGALPGLTGAFYYWALAMLPASLGIILLFQFTWIGVGLEWLLTREKPGPSRWLALFLLVPGTVLAAGLEGGSSPQFHWLGVMLGFLSALTYTGYLSAAGRVATSVSPWARSAWISTGATITTSIFFSLFLTGDGGGKVGDLLLYGGLMGLFGALLPTVCFAYGVPVIGGGLAGILGAVELPVVLLVSRFFLGEPVGLRQWLGTILMLAGIYIGEKGEHFFKKTLEY